MIRFFLSQKKGLGYGYKDDAEEWLELRKFILWKGIMPEKTIYTDEHITVSTSRVTIRGMTYHLRNITSVKMTQGASDENGGGCLTLIGIGFLLMTCFYKFSSKALIVSLGVTVLGIIWLSKAKGIYNVTLTSASVETHALSSKDINYIEKVVGNINEAIVHSG